MKNYNFKYTDFSTLMFFISFMCLIQDYFGKEVVFKHLSNIWLDNGHWGLWFIPITFFSLDIYFKRKSNDEIVDIIQTFLPKKNLSPDPTSAPDDTTNLSSNAPDQVSSLRMDTLKDIMESEGEHVEIAKITAADFNGKTFDGFPFKLINVDKFLSPEFCNALIKMQNEGSLKLSTAGCTDYATWDFIDRDMVVENFGPGDFIIYNEKIGVVPCRAVDIITTYSRIVKTIKG